MTELLFFVLGVAAWAAIMLGSVGAVAAVYWLRERWRK
ncbi:membrane protein [Arthrobacter phage Adumb2043]|uniref:Membrane protein n=1 Tax=Arthrobacter phage Adumb2043 TaxID=2776851 RepID=A0A7M1CKZ1_9CAUD|nr:membrane protein [Arthrobacter phage Adumb2043]QOP65125.1 membrane protein [Arthrobacter phage Adumb2043]